MTRKSCDCHRYEQTGVPCEHAILLTRHLGIAMNKEYFDTFCFIAELNLMFEDCVSKNSLLYTNLFATVLPSEDSILKFIVGNDEVNTLFSTLEVLDGNETSLESPKRIRSQGNIDQ